jgi:hypothetical protein
MKLSIEDCRMASQALRLAADRNVALAREQTEQGRKDFLAEAKRQSALADRFVLEAPNETA